MIADDITTKIQQAIAQDKLQVTTRDTDALSGKMGTINTKMTITMVMIGLVITLLVATYGINAFLFWRMAERLVAS